MNAIRRKQLLKLWNKIEEIRDEVSGLQDDEQEAYDNMPESLQYSERGDRMEEIIDTLGYAVDSLQEAMDNIGESIN